MQFKLCAIAKMALCAGTALAALPGTARSAAPAGSEYRLSLLKVGPSGSFLPVGISDGNLVPGTLSTPLGSTVGNASAAAAKRLANDFCGRAGAADKTTLSSMSPYSSTAFVAGICSRGSFSRNLQSKTTTYINYPQSFYSEVDGIGSGGLVVGRYDLSVDSNTKHGFYVFGTTYIPFDPPGSLNTYPDGININNVVFGEYEYETSTTSTVNYGFLLDLSGNYTTIGFPGAVRTALNGVNGNNLAVGDYWASNSPFQQPQAFAYTSGFFYTLPVNGAVTSNVSAVNEHGIATGTYTAADGSLHGFVWKIASGSLITFVPPANTKSLWVRGINNSNVITGVYYDQGNKPLAFAGTCTGTSCF